MRTMEIKLRAPLDMHIHFRDGGMLNIVAPFTARAFSAAVIMPNLVPPVNSFNTVHAYRQRIIEAIGDESFKPLMTVFFRDFTEKELIQLKDEVIGVKLYPDGVTTNSSGGVTSLRDAERILSILQELDIPLMVHGETDGFVLDRETAFLSIYAKWAEKFPRLKITMEHITTADAVKLVNDYEHLRATVTLHHLVLTLDDVIGGMLNPHHFCKPIIKRPKDREALMEAVLEAHPKLMFGSDSAPHPRSAKESAQGAAGIFSAPILLPCLAQLFEQHHALAYLQAFVSDNAKRLYGLVNLPEKEVTLHEQPWQVPERVGEVVPMFAGKTLKWSLSRLSHQPLTTSSNTGTDKALPSSSRDEDGEITGLAGK